MEEKILKILKDFIAIESISCSEKENDPIGSFCMYRRIYEQH